MIKKMEQEEVNGAIYGLASVNDKTTPVLFDAYANTNKGGNILVLGRPGGGKHFMYKSELDNQNTVDNCTVTDGRENYE